MSQLTQRAMRVYAVLESYRGGSNDILDALLPFFEPILMEFRGQTLNQDAFAGRVRSSYHWSFTADIVEELIPRFQARGWVEQASPRTTPPSYVVTYNNPAAAALGPNEIHIGQVLSRVSQEFQQFIGEISPLTAVSKTPEELSDILVEWLVSIDAYSEDVLQQQLVQTSDTGRIGYLAGFADSSGLHSEERYLCARFVKKLHRDRSPYIADLCKLASVGLLTEVIQDFRKPVTRVNQTNLALYLDAPVALDLLGTSGTLAAENIRPTIAKLREIGASVRIFRQSVDELQHVLQSLLQRSPPDRTGLTAAALRRGEVVEGFVRQVAQNPDSILASQGISIVERRLNQYPNEHQFFTQEQYEALYSRMHWHSAEVQRREHDSTILALIMRLRARVQSPDLFQTRHLLITRNGPLAQLAKSFCVTNSLMSRSAVAPIIHQRQLATAVWLRTGLQDMAEVPRRYVLAACERVLELRKNVVDEVKLAARTLTPEKAEQLELLLTQDRSVQLLLDKTLGVSHVVNSTNIEALVDGMKRALTEDIENEANERVTSHKREADSRVRKASEARRAAESRAQTLDDTLAVYDSEDLTAVRSLIDKTNQKLKWRRRIMKWAIGAFILFVGASPIMTETLSAPYKYLVLGASGVIGALFAFFQVFDRPVGLEAHFEKWARKSILRLAQSRGIAAKLARFDIKYQAGLLVEARKEGVDLEV